MILPWGSGGLDKKVFAQFGVDLGTLTDYEKYKINLAKKVANYARALGIRTILPGYMGWVPSEFVKKHPECRYVDVKWGEAPSAAHLHPSDPMFVKVGEAFIKEYIKEYGTDHIYNIDPYPETRPGATPEEQKEIRISFPKAVSEYIKKADPKGVWYASGWAFLDRGYWPLEDVRDFLNAIPNDMFYVCDIWAESNPIYKELNYFHGKKWGFSVLLCFGGDDYLRGNLADLIRRVKEVAADPKAKNCQVLYINPEIIHYNTLYFELAAKLAWNPQVDLEEFLKDYALRRYGKESQENMVRVLLKLADSIYGQLGGEEALYQHRLYSLPPPSLNREKVIKDLREAIELALREKGKQKDNPLYQHDLVDILRQYITELFNIHIKKLNLSFQNADKAGFEKEAKVIGHLMDGLEKLLASREDYRIEPIIKKAKKAPGAPQDIERKVKDDMFTFAGTPWLLDYQSKDMYELVRFYYRPRVEAFINTLGKELGKTKGIPSTPNPDELTALYRKIEEEWLEKPIEVKDKFRATMLQAVEEVFNSLKRFEPEIPSYIVPNEKVGAAGWRKTFQTYQIGTQPMRVEL
jgi:alpha-N-acetylglucosaminidase